jgi:predicted AlkP superfamily phosphohydrolase/phosphomutase
MWKHAIVSIYPANDILIKAHGETIANFKKEKMGNVSEEKRDSLKETLAIMLEKLSSNTTVH